MGKNAILRDTTEGGFFSFNLYKWDEGVRSYLVHDILEGVWAVNREADE
jgi:hypothetical protein